MFRTSICPSAGIEVVCCCVWCSVLFVTAYGVQHCLLLHMVFSTRCFGCGPKEPVCSLVHCV